MTAARPDLSFSVEFPDNADDDMDQDSEWMTVNLLDPSRREETLRIRFHDYARIYQIPGLYEHVFSDLLQCRSPEIMARLAARVVAAGDLSAGGGLRLLDIGAGGGLVAEALAGEVCLERAVGVDILPEASEAAVRDRPGLYDDYIVADLTCLGEEERARLSSPRPNMLACVAALGFDDIPVDAFTAAFNFVEPGGAVIFSIKDAFLEGEDRTGFAAFVEDLLARGNMDVCVRERFFHRYSVAGKMLHYIGVGGTKVRDYHGLGALSDADSASQRRTET